MPLPDVLISRASSVGKAALLVAVCSKLFPSIPSGLATQELKVPEVLVYM